ncbi:MAG TPA: ABC transporter ATP-binding protein [Actinomycetes bacterium]|jgi:ABC-2 type transport system ATP-binding protein|nr:ABC transporter ATP-binding protein [Actinomycetes bacterium]
MTMTAIATDRLTKRFGAVTAVADLDLEVHPGEVVGFLGPNGAGKTTTIRLLLGFLRPSAGRCQVLGGSLARQAGLRRRVGYLPGDLKVDPAMTGEQLFSWFGRLRGGIDRARIGELVERLGLDPSTRFGTLSKGNRQKVGLVQAFQHDPDVLLLDEPTSGLDPLVQREFLRLVAEAAERGAAVLFSSHVLPEVERAASRIAIIRQGRLVAVSTVEELLDRARHRLELRFSQPPPAGFLQGVPGVRVDEVDGRTASITVDGPVGPALRAATELGGLLRVRGTGDDLEDLFVSLYQQQPAEVT